MKRLIISILRKQQAGYTLVELVVVIAILGLLTVAINAGITQTVRVGANSSEYITAIKQGGNAMQWLAKDIPQAQTVKLGKESGFPIELAWIEWDGTTYSVNYSMSGTSLVRTQVINSGAPQQTIVANYLDVTSNTTCRYMDQGTFHLPDIGDSFTIFGGAAEDNGLLVTSSGSVTMAVSGNATRDSDTWTASDDGRLVVTAASVHTRGIWTTTDLNAGTCLTSDADNDATLTGNAIMIQITTYGGEMSRKSETRVSLFFPRSRM
jgi:prepilin-type N-terminal cleavage/methylation domain-containing protein